MFSSAALFELTPKAKIICFDFSEWERPEQGMAGFDNFDGRWRARLSFWTGFG